MKLCSTADAEIAEEPAPFHCKFNIDLETGSVSAEPFLESEENMQGKQFLAS